MHVSRFLAAAALLAVPLQAQPAQVTAIRADRLIVGDGTQIASPVVLIQGERITAVGPAASVTVPRDARLIDLRGHTLLPGFIDAHTHLASIDNDGGDLSALKETPAHGAIYATVTAKKTVEAGFTTVREAGSLGYVDVAVRDAINRGLIPGPRIRASGPALGTTGGHADVNGWSPFLNLPGTGAIVDGADAVRRQVRLNVKYGADQIKIVATGGILSVGDAIGAPQMTDEELHAAVSEAVRLGRKVMAHAHAGEGLLGAVRAGVASIEHGSLVSDEAIAEMKQRGTYLVPTLIILEEIVRDGASKGVPPYAVEKAKAIAAERRVRLRGPGRCRREPAGGYHAAATSDVRDEGRGDGARERGGEIDGVGGVGAAAGTSATGAVTIAPNHVKAPSAHERSDVCLSGVGMSEVRRDFRRSNDRGYVSD
ncbi:MAG: amidohydrolase family protein [Gemmatimonadaceae bacterium]